MRTQIRLLAAPVVVGLAVALTACSSSTEGSGGGGNAVTSAAAPTSSAPAPKTVTVTRPVSSAATSAAPVTSSAPAASSSASSSSSSANPVPAQPLQVATASAPDSGTKYVVKIWAQDQVTDCAANAYGRPVIDYLKTHGCLGVRRLLATTTVNGKAVGFAQSDTGFKGPTVGKSYEYAGNFCTLVTKDGTGNIKDLFRAGDRLPSGPSAVPSPDAFSALGQDNSCTVVDAWYLDGPTPENDPALVKMAQDIYLQF